MRTKPPGRPGNDLDDDLSPDFHDWLERGIFLAFVPIGITAITILGGGYLVHQVVTSWL